jgi:hypothetical protein
MRMLTMYAACRNHMANPGSGGHGGFRRLLTPPHSVDVSVRRTLPSLYTLQGTNTSLLIASQIKRRLSVLLLPVSAYTPARRSETIRDPVPMQRGQLAPVIRLGIGVAPGNDVSLIVFVLLSCRASQGLGKPSWLSLVCIVRQYCTKVNSGQSIYLPDLLLYNVFGKSEQKSQNRGQDKQPSAGLSPHAWF